MGKAYEALKKTGRTRQAAANSGMLPPDALVWSGTPKRRAPPQINWDLDPFNEEEYQKLRGNLFLGPERAGFKTLLVVASAHGEGATTTATLLASVLAKANHAQLLLVDANLRTPSFAEIFNYTDDPRGLTDLITGSMSLDEVVRPTPFSNLSVITSGRPFSSPSYLFDAASVERTMQMWCERYDLIIIDGAPVRDYADSCFLSSMVDGTILVVEAEKTRADVALGSKRQLERSGAHVLGTVLNKKKRYLPAFLERFL
jgi:capsular exopolysaccharide synthesis family protein